MEGQKEEKKETPEENPDWLSTLMSEGVTSLKSEKFLFSIEPDKYKGNKVALMKAQEERAVSILKRVAEHEFPGLKFEVDDHDVPWTTYFHVTARGGLRVASTYYIHLSRDRILSIYTDEELENNARKALYSLLFQDDA